MKQVPWESMSAADPDGGKLGQAPHQRRSYPWPTHRTVAIPLVPGWRTDSQGADGEVRPVNLGPMTLTFSAGGVVLNPRGQVLVVNQKGTSWSLPKGHIDAGEEALEAARREVQEESGIGDLELAADLGTYRRQRIGGRGGTDEAELKQIAMYLFRTNRKVVAVRPGSPGPCESRLTAACRAHAEPKGGRGGNPQIPP